MQHKEISIRVPWPTLRLSKDTLSAWLPSRGNILFTLVMIAVLLWAQSAGAVPFRAESAVSTGTIAYQGRLADSAGNPLTSTLNMSFRLYAASTGGTPLWSEQWTGPNGVKVSDGLFNVMLGSLTPIPQSVITGNANLFLGITVGTDDEMTPRVQLGSVPFAVQALTVPDGSVTTAKIADGAVTQAKLGSDISLVPPDGSISTAKLADHAVTAAKLGVPLMKIVGLDTCYNPCTTTSESQKTGWQVMKGRTADDNLEVVASTNGSPVLVQISGGLVHRVEQVITAQFRFCRTGARSDLFICIAACRKA